MNSSFGPDLTRILAAATENIRRTVAATVMPPVEIRIPAMNHLAEAIAPLQPALERLDAMMPTNWQGSHLAYSEIIVLMQEGVPLAWVPPADVIRQLLTADDAASRAQVIDDCRPAILTSCKATLAAVTDARFSEQKALLEECVHMAEHGMFSGAQALAANVWDTLIRGLAFANPGWLKPNSQWPGYSRSWRTSRPWMTTTPQSASSARPRPSCHSRGRWSRSGRQSRFMNTSTGTPRLTRPRPRSTPRSTP